MTPAENILSRLDRVKRTGADRWIASCPTRADKRPSMTIRELPDGRVLLHDFGGDSVQEILAALGLELSDLFPEKLTARGPGKPHRERRPFDPLDVLRVLDVEALIALRFVTGMARGEQWTDGDFDRLVLAVERIGDARRLYAR